MFHHFQVRKNRYGLNLGAVATNVVDFIDDFVPRFRVANSGKTGRFTDIVAQFFARALIKLAVKSPVLQPLKLRLENTVQCFVFILVKKHAISVVRA